MQSTASLRQFTCDATTQRLRGAVERMIETFPSDQPKPVRVAQSYPDLIRLLAFEIDETVLPRTLVLVHNDIHVAQLVVTNRRLVAMTVEGQSVAPLSETDPDPDDVAQQYAGALARLFASTGVLELRSAGRAAQAVTGSTACTGQRLAAVSDKPVAQNRVKQFLQSAHSGSLGWIYRSDGEEAVAHDPDAAIFDALKTLDAALDAQAEQRTASHKLDRPGPLCTAFSLLPGVQVLVATHRKTQLVLAVPEADFSDVMTHWQSVFRSPENG